MKNQRKPEAFQYYTKISANKINNPQSTSAMTLYISIDPIDQKAKIALCTHLLQLRDLRGQDRGPGLGGHREVTKLLLQQQAAAAHGQLSPHGGRELCTLGSTSQRKKKQTIQPSPKPTSASILSSKLSRRIKKPAHHGNDQVDKKKKKIQHNTTW